MACTRKNLTFYCGVL